MFSKSIVCVTLLSLSAIFACSGKIAPTDPPEVGSSSDNLVTRADGSILVYAPTVSSDSAQNPAFIGSTILFTVFHRGYNNGSAGLFTSDPLGVVKTILDPRDADYVNLPGSAFNPLTNRITWAADRNGFPDNIWTSNPDGTNIHQVTNLNTAIEPSFSPDGTKLVFEYAPGGGNHRIGRVNVDGTGLVYLTDGTHDDHQPNWSPSGNLVVFQRSGSNDDFLYTIHPDGTNLVNLNVIGTDASFSPDGNWIVYSGGVFTQYDTIMVVPKNGGSLIRVCHSNVYDGAPSWSPDGKWIAFESGGNGSNPTSIWKIAAPVSVNGVDAGIPFDSGVVLDSGTDAAKVDSGVDSGFDSGLPNCNP